MNIGFIGLGIMGKPMAVHLLQAGYKLNVYNRSIGPVTELAAQGAIAKKCAKDVAEDSNIIITMLPDSPQVEEVILGENGVIEGAKQDCIVIDMSSINPAVTQSIAAKLEKKGIDMLDAPVSGGEIGAIEGKLSIMAGGKQPIFDQVKPILEKMGSTITRVGNIGAGNTVKLMNQIIVAINMVAISEALSFGTKANIDPIVAYEALRGGLAGSRVLETKINNLAQEIYAPGFRVELHKKDLINAKAYEQQLEANLPFTTQVLTMLEKLEKLGFHKEDHSALYRLYR